MSVDSAQYRVLVVDDDAAMRMTIQAILEEGFEVVTCASAQRALYVLEKETFDVIVADWRMPGMDGIEFLRRVSAQSTTVACLLITGHVDDLSKEVAWTDRKTVGLLRKPFKPEQFLDRVQHLAQLSKMKRSINRLNETADLRLKRT